VSHRAERLIFNGLLGAEILKIGDQFVGASARLIEHVGKQARWRRTAAADRGVQVWRIPVEAAIFQFLFSVFGLRRGWRAGEEGELGGQKEGQQAWEDGEMVSDRWAHAG
jgi:hypothetical protein